MPGGASFLRRFTPPPGHSLQLVPFFLRQHEVATPALRVGPRSDKVTR